MFHPKGPTFWELAVQALSSTQRGYDLLAPKFDYTPFRTPQGLLDAVGEQLDALGPFDAGLDICCGTGAAMAVIRRRCRQRVAGIDFSQGMLEVARQRTADAPGDAQLEFVRGDVLAMPFAAAFDLAVSFGAFGHILQQDEPRFVAEIARLLRPGGRFIFITTPMPRMRSAALLVVAAVQRCHARAQFPHQAAVHHVLPDVLVAGSGDVIAAAWVRGRSARPGISGDVVGCSPGDRHADSLREIAGRPKSRSFVLFCWQPKLRLVFSAAD